MPTFIDDLKPLVLAYLQDSRSALQSMDELKEWNSLSDIENNILTLKQLIETTLDAIDSLEDVVDEVLCDAKKREAAIECLDAFIDLPVYLEWVDDIALRLLVSLVQQERPCA